MCGRHPRQGFAIKTYDRSNRLISDLQPAPRGAGSGFQPHGAMGVALSQPPSQRCVCVSMMDGHLCGIEAKTCISRDVAKHPSTPRPWSSCSAFREPREGDRARADIESSSHPHRDPSSPLAPQSPIPTSQALQPCMHMHVLLGGGPRDGVLVLTRPQSRPRSSVLGCHVGLVLVEMQLWGQG